MALSLNRQNSSATEHLLTCSVCLDHFTDPRSLTACLHTFCASCLEQVRDKLRKVIVCPMCKAETRLTTQGVKGLPCDFKIQQVKDILESGDFGGGAKRGGVDRDKCDVCKEKSATSHCATCAVVFCADCVRKHNSNPVLRVHTVVSIKPADTVNSSLVCAKHTGHFASFVCLDCKPKAVLCAICILDHNKTHTPTDFASARKVLKDQLKESLGRVKAGGSLISQYLMEADKMRNKYEVQLTKIQEDISRQAAKLVGQIQAEEFKLIKEAQEKIETIVSKYDYDGARAQLAKIEHLGEELAKALNSSSDETCVVSHDHLSQKVQDMKQFKIPTVREATVEFVPHDPAKFQLALGTLRDCTVASAETTRRFSPVLDPAGGTSAKPVKRPVVEQKMITRPTAPPPPRPSPTNRQRDVSNATLSTCEGCKEQKYPLVGMYCLKRRTIERLCQKCRRKHDIIGHPAEWTNGAQ